MATKKAAKKKTAAGKTAPKTKATKKARTRPAAPRAAASALKIRSASPSFTVNDLAKSLAWYTDVLGFAVEQRWENDGKLLGVELRAGDVTFMIGQDDWKKGRDRRKGEGFRIFCTTAQSVDAIAQRIKANGGRLDQEPQDQPWGMRDFALTDPDGFKITVAADRK
jgi:uncharacterized glyoxalase superfamily protein PhnB